MRAPLNLPPGSVRALSTLALIGTVCAIAIIKGQVPADLSALTGTALAFYFRARETEAPEKKEAPDA